MRKTVDLTCEFCGEEFNREQTEHRRCQRNGRRSFCSLSCAGKYYGDVGRENIKIANKCYRGMWKLSGLPLSELRQIGAAVRQKIKQGDLARPDKCELCGGGNNIDAHHEDYGKPYDVVWLCRSCHMRVHLGTLEISGVA